MGCAVGWTTGAAVGRAAAAVGALPTAALTAGAAVDAAGVGAAAGNAPKAAAVTEAAAGGAGAARAGTAAARAAAEAGTAADAAAARCSTASWASASRSASAARLAAALMASAAGPVTVTWAELPLVRLRLCLLLSGDGELSRSAHHPPSERQSHRICRFLACIQHAYLLITSRCARHAAPIGPTLWISRISYIPVRQVTGWRNGCSLEETGITEEHVGHDLHILYLPSNQEASPSTPDEEGVHRIASSPPLGLLGYERRGRSGAGESTMMGMPTYGRLGQIQHAQAPMKLTVVFAGGRGV